MERETGIEPAAPTLARSCSTTELFPQKLGQKTRGFYQRFIKKSSTANKDNDFLIQCQPYLETPKSQCIFKEVYACRIPKLSI